MTAGPLISVALCTYNGERFLREQMDSLLAQTYSNFEIVAVDDCSTDGTLSLLREYKSQDRRVAVHVNTINLGFRKNFEHAMSLCRGDLISPCDQDDIWLPEKLELLHGALGNCAMVYCDSDIIDEHGRSQNRPMSSRCNMVSTNDAAVFVAANCVAGHSMLFRRRLLARAFPVPDCFYYDWWLAAIATTAGGVAYLDRQLVKYRFHDSNVTNVLRERPATIRGRRDARFREFGLRLEELVRVQEAEDPFLVQMRDLWKAREDQWFSPALAGFMYRHWRRIYAIRKSRARLLPALKFVAGLKLKRFTNPGAYRHDPPQT
jgi:glycosyltransferase involved in cell wall biosynthesis